jgi:hypothetical protein
LFSPSINRAIVARVGKGERSTADLVTIVASDQQRHLILGFLCSFRFKVCSLLLIVHEDVYGTADEKAIVDQLELWADIVINVEPLATGQHRDVHGQVKENLILASNGRPKKHIKNVVPNLMLIIF